VLRRGDSIQAAIDDVDTQAGDEIVLAPGEYVGRITIDKDITIRSVDPSDRAIVEATVIRSPDGQLGTVVTFAGLGDDGPGAWLDGVTVTGGAAHWGAGIVVEEAATISRCVVRDNHAVEFSGGLDHFPGDGSLLIFDCIFLRNGAADGGAMTIAGLDVIVLHSEFAKNTAQSGGAVRLTAGASGNLVGCVFHGNEAVDDGGAISSDAPLAIKGCEFTGNSAGIGGALYMTSPDVVITGCMVIENIAASQGGGVFAAGPPLIEGSTICGNEPNEISGDFVSGGGNTICCPGDLDLDASVGFTDLVGLLAAWGPCPDCAADLDGDDVVGLTDLVQLLASWGPCSG